MYGDHVYFVQISGCRGELVCFKKMSDYILRKFKEDGHESKEDVIRVAAKLIKEDIREAKYMKEFYPTIESILNTEKTSLVPNSLQILMKYLISSDLKRESISQCIVQAAKPRSSIMPIPFGVGVEVDKTMGSEWLITHLQRLGFSVSYDEVSRFKQSAIAKTEDTIDTNQEPMFAQWVGDNVDHDIATLTGKGTFHGMGMICSSREPVDIGAIPRVKKILSSTFAKERGVDIVTYQKIWSHSLTQLKFDPLRGLNEPSSK